MHHLLPELQSLDAQFPTQRKLLLVPSINFGRELLASLAHAQGGWVGWEVATLATVAGRLSLMELARQELRPGSDTAVADAVSAAFDEAVLHKQVSPALASLAWSAGTRRALSDAVLELRVAGVSAAQLHALGSVGVSQSLAAVLELFEQTLKARGLADTAGVFGAALTDLDGQAPFVLDHALLVAAPGWTVRGAPRQLFSRLAQLGLKVLAPLSLEGAEQPDGLVEQLAPLTEFATAAAGAISHAERLTRSAAMFCAGTPADEVRAVVRQVLASGKQLDDVEIVCTDRDVYGVTLDALCSQIGASCTMLDGLPLASTRVGRALERWLLWIESGFQATVLREALESGDLAPEGDAAGTQLAAELRSLKIGWGLDATQRAAGTLRSAFWIDRIKPWEGEEDDAFTQRRARRAGAMGALASFLESMLALAPDPATPIEAAGLATRTAAVLQFMVPHGPAERATQMRLGERLAEVAAVPGVPMSLTNALATLRQELGDLRAWTDSSRTAKPRRATGGHIHLTSLENAGATGRPVQFIVGLDADRTAGPVLQSPLLPDMLRARLNERGAELPTTEQRRRERAWQLGLAVNGSNASLTLSYAVRGSGEGREATPAPMLLDIARRQSGNASLGYRELHAVLGAPRSPVPVEGSATATAETAIDARDVWLGAMSDGPLLLDATEALRQTFSGLDRGLAAATAREQPDAGEYHGLVPAAGTLDPRLSGKPISPSSLERIARCGLNWFYSVALNARVPEEPVYDPLVWLNPLDRGSALHTIYERIMRDQVHERAAGADRDARVQAVVQAVAREMEAVVPAPSGTVRTREIAALLDEARLFVTSEHAEFAREPWKVVALESQFGGEHEPAVVTLDDGSSFHVHGRVDRVDRLQDGTLRLVDYKTGRAFELDGKHGAFEGGRKLQLALYSPAISAQFSAVVSLAEYRFTTAKGDGAVARADEEMLAAAPRIVRSLLEDVAAGRFLPTMDKEDCRYCDYAAVCRVTTTRFSSESPRAQWAKEHGELIVQYAGMRERRSGGSE